jgi:hypothetical protein
VEIAGEGDEKGWASGQWQIVQMQDREMQSVDAGSSNWVQREAVPQYLQPWVYTTSNSRGTEWERAKQ